MPIGIYQHKKGSESSHWSGGKPICKCGKVLWYGSKTCYKCRPLSNENNPAWKGQGIDYHWLHRWINREWGRPKKCEYCGTTKAKRFEWANISGKYLRLCRKDWMRVCSSCHIKNDRYKSITLKTNV